jgi:hypothetical protein
VSTLHVMNTTMTKERQDFKILGDRLNIHIPNPNIDPTKEEFLSHEALDTHMFQDNLYPHF